MQKVYADPSLQVRRTDRFYRPTGAKEYYCPDDADPVDSVDATYIDEFFE